MVSNILMLLLFPESTFFLSVQTEKKNTHKKDARIKNWKVVIFRFQLSQSCIIT